MARRKPKTPFVPGYWRRPVLHRVFMAALSWVRQDIDDKRFAEAVQNAAEALNRGEP